MTIHSFHNDLEHKVAASAFMDPAAAYGAFTVAAVNQSVWNQSSPATEPFSSRGPTNDGRIKPDLTGPDGTTSLTYGTRGGYGTSFSSPTVAGAAALILAHDPTLTPDELEDALRFSARDVGAQGNDNTYGSGLLELAVPSGEQPSANTPPTAVADAALGITGQAIAINVLANDFDADGDPLSVRIATASTKGSAVVKSDRTITFTSALSFVGTTSFTYEISDPDGATHRAVVTVTVTAAVVAPTSPPSGSSLASDLFADTSTSGGTGWSGSWSFTGYALPTSLAAPASAPYHLRLRAGSGLAQRSVAPGSMTSLRLVYRAKISDFEAGDTAVVKVSKDNGASWITIQTFTSAHSDDVYRSFDLDLAPFGVGSASTLRIAFDSNMNASTDYFYIDDVAVHGAR